MMKRKNDNNEIIRKKLEFYFSNKTKLHISCTNNLFYNGYILEFNNKKDLMVFIDDKFGSVPILYEEIASISPYQEDM